MYTKNETFSGLFAQFEDMFGEIDSNLTTALRDSDEEYATMRSNRRELAQRFSFIEPMLEGDDGLSLSAEKLAALQEYYSMSIQIESRERLNLYYAGHRHCFAYLHKIGVI